MNNDAECSQLQAFEYGVDDYQIKPIAIAVMLARAESLMRRATLPNHRTNAELKTIGNLTIDTQAHRCMVEQQVVKLSSFEFKLLNLFAENVGNVLSRDNIYGSLLRREYNGVERTVDVRIAKLREKLTNIGLKNVEIETVWGRGYVLNDINVNHYD